jgi:hypothetical protein
MGMPALWWFVGIVGLAMFFGGVFVAAGGRGSAFSWKEELFGGLFFGLAGLGCALVAYRQYRRFRPAPLRTIGGVELGVENVEARRGDEVVASVSHGSEADLQVGLVCEERYDIQSNAQTKAGLIQVRQTNSGTVYEEWAPVPAEPGEHVLRFQVPRGAPCSYEGECLSYVWRVSARRVQRLQADPRIDRPIWVRA